MDVSRGESVARRVDALVDLLRQSDKASYFGEPVSQLAHALQAAHFASVAGASETEVVGALLHDVGHLCDPAAAITPDLGVIDHAAIGARYLREMGFGDDVTALVGGHVDAKRYLTWKNAGYRDQLSAASQQTLALQGGPMGPEEAAAFENGPRFRTSLRLRRWDELGKQVGLAVPELDTYRPRITRCLAASSLTMICRSL